MITAKLLKLRKTFALIAIYLVVSITFITFLSANALATFTYDVSGANGVSGFIKNNTGVVQISVESDSSDVSFITAKGSTPLSCTPLTEDKTGPSTCTYELLSTDINSNVKNLSFTLKQSSGDPAIIKGSVSVDSMAPPAPKINVDPTSSNSYLNVTKTSGGLLFNYRFKDYLYSDNEQECLGSGIGRMELLVQQKTIDACTVDIVNTQNCTISGECFANYSGTFNNIITYSVILTDRVGNEYRSKLNNLSGDFRAPLITKDFTILSSGKELTTFSSTAQIPVDILINIEDSSLDTSNIRGGVRADFSGLNSNPAINNDPMYKNYPATCTSSASNTYNCMFKNVMLRPSSSMLNITVYAYDNDSNRGVQPITKSIILQDDAGKVSYLGPLKNHCTADLSQCFIKSGPQLIEADLDTSSNFNHSIINFAINADATFGVCQLNQTWKCMGVYLVSSDVSSLDVVISESYDDYNNMLVSDASRNIQVDNVGPVNVSEIIVTNNNNNVNCSVSGDELTFSMQIEEDTSEPKIYADTTQITTSDKQTGKCVVVDNSPNLWDCTLTITDFVSSPISVSKNIIIEDLAGNQLKVNKTINVCQASSSNAPNVIYSITQGGNLPDIDRRTASKIGVKTYIPLKISVKDSATLMYLSVDSCTASGEDGLNVMGTESNYLTPNNGNNPILALTIGHKKALLPESGLDINCTLSAKVKVGATVYTKVEKKKFTVHVTTSNSALGSIDVATDEEINTIKSHLRDLDDEIATREKWDKFLNTICTLAETIGKANTVMQAVKSVLYVVAMIINEIPPLGPGAAQAMWTAVQGFGGTFHEIVTQWIWPPGMVPTSFGSGVKYSCMVYTCKHLDLGTYTGLAFDLATTYGGPGEKGVGSTDSEGNTNTMQGTPVEKIKIDMSKSTVIIREDPSVTAFYNARSSLDGSMAEAPSIALKSLGTTRSVVLQKASTDTALSSKQVAGLDKSGKLVTYDARAGVYSTTENLANALGDHQWILNPYRSVHFDDTCNPAIIYNLKKDRQINCMYLTCLKKQSDSGVPKIVCDNTYKVNKCLYLDSAEYLLAGESVWNAFFKGLGSAFVASGLGLVIQTTYTVACWNYFVPGGSVYDLTLTVNGFHSAACGLAGAYFGVKEVVDFVENNPLYKLKGMDPAKNKDYCAGLDYSEVSEESITGDEYDQSEGYAIQKN